MGFRLGTEMHMGQVREFFWFLGAIAPALWIGLGGRTDDTDTNTHWQY